MPPVGPALIGQRLSSRILDLTSNACLQPDADIRESSAGDLRESVLHRYAQSCNVVRGRLLIDQ